MARCSFDIHVQEILGALTIGALLVILHPRGTIDFEYLSKVLHKKQITYMHTVPSLLHRFFTFIGESNNQHALKYLRSLCSIGESLFNILCVGDMVLFLLGEPFVVRLFDLITTIGLKNRCIWNLYGPAETTIASTFHLVNNITYKRNISIGVTLASYQCMIVDEFLQSVTISHEGELLVGGVGVFAGYLGRDDLTMKALIEINGELFYRTGDLVRIDNNGLLHYRGRKDHQIKLHGQRIELGEIERCLLNITSITACVVIKWGDDHLIAYVQSSTINDSQLRQHCQLHLPPYMIPSIFIILDKLPLNANGKVDRKLLPPPLLSVRSPLPPRNDIELLSSTNDIEVTIHHIWCDIFQQTHISIDANIFTIGGHSLLLMQLYQLYKTTFHLKTNCFSIADLFQHPTIIDHARFIHQAIDMKEQIDDHWFSLHLIQGKESNSL